MTTTTVNKYRIYCNTDSQWEEVWAEIMPTTCPVDTGHTVNSNSVQFIENVSDSNVRIIEETTPTGGFYRAQGLSITAAAANSVSEHDFTFHHPISGLEVQWKCKTENVGDSISCTVAPNTIVGGITSDVSASDTTINVQQSVVDNAAVGYLVNLFDGTNTDDLGYVTAIDKNGLTITVSTAATQAFATATPTHVRVGSQMAKNLSLDLEGHYGIGGSKIGGSYIPAGKVLRIYYDNKHATDTKDLTLIIEYLY